MRQKIFIVCDGPRYASHCLAISEEGHLPLCNWYDPENRGVDLAYLVACDSVRVFLLDEVPRPHIQLLLDVADALGKPVLMEYDDADAA